MKETRAARRTIVPETGAAAAGSFHDRCPSATRRQGPRLPPLFRRESFSACRLDSAPGAPAVGRLEPAAAAGWSSLLAFTSLSTMAQEQPSFAERCQRMLDVAGELKDIAAFVALEAERMAAAKERFAAHRGRDSKKASL